MNPVRSAQKVRKMNRVRFARKVRRVNRVRYVQFLVGSAEDGFGGAGGVAGADEGTEDLVEVLFVAAAGL